MDNHISCTSDMKCKTPLSVSPIAVVPNEIISDSLETEAEMHIEKGELETFMDSSVLNSEQILSLFDGNFENFRYFKGLRDAVLELNKGQDTRCSCDPRDETKVLRLGSWKPAVILRDLEDETSLSSGTDIQFTKKQTVVENDSFIDSINRQSVDESNKTDSQLDGTGQKKRASFVCGVQGCCERFDSLASYETHYHLSHNYVCATCRRSFVSNFLLDIHLQENHDSYFQILSPRIDMYQCLVESCKLKFRTPSLRKDHLLSVHRFPPSFSFHRPLKTNPAVASQSQSDAMEVDGSKRVSSGRGKAKDRNKNSSGYRVPANICFGRGSQRAFQTRGRGGKGRHWHQTVSEEDKPKMDIEHLDMTDLKESLNG